MAHKIASFIFCSILVFFSSPSFANNPWGYGCSSSFSYLNNGFSVGETVFDEDGFRAMILSIASDGTATLSWDGFDNRGRRGVGKRSVYALRKQVQTLGGFQVGDLVRDEDGFTARILEISTGGEARLSWDNLGNRGRRGIGRRNLSQIRPY